MWIPLLAMAQAVTRTPQLAAWEDLHYGMFIHYGMSTFDQSEINDGQSAPSLYNPTDLDVRQWVRTAKRAGMKYAVLTAKHTAGFCLWPSGDYDVTQSPVKTDVVGEFMKACKAEGIKPGIYYCIMDGHNEGRVTWDAPLTPEYFSLVKKHLTQLHTRYPGIFEQWLDIPGKLTPNQRRELYDLIHRLSPGCLVLMNVSIWTKPGTSMPEGAWPTDLAVGERNAPPTRHNPVMEIHGNSYYMPLEVCDTLEENWFWVKGDEPRTVRRLYKIYQNSVGRGANLLLDVPPDTTGKIPQSSVQRLMELKKAIDHPDTMSTPPSLTFGKEARASNVYHQDEQWSPKSAVDGDDSTRWATDDDAHQAWLEVDLDSEQTFRSAMLSEAYPNRVRRFDLQALRGTEWKTFYHGTTIGPDLRVRFKPVTARRVRLNVLEASVGPTIWEFQLYAR